MGILRVPVSAETARAEQNVGSGSAGRTVIVEAPVDVVSPLLERLLAEHFGAVTRSGAMEMRCTRPGAVFTGRVHATLFGTSTTTIDLRTRSELAGWFKVGVRLVLVPALGFAGLYVSFLAELNPVAGTGVFLVVLIAAVVLYMRIARLVADRWIQSAFRAFSAIEARLRDEAKTSAYRG